MHLPSAGSRLHHPVKGEGSIFTAYTWQDWLSENGSRDLLLKIIRTYKASADFKNALTAQSYFDGDNEAIRQKVVLKANTINQTDETGRVTKILQNQEIAGARLANGFFTRAVMQQNQFLLGNGVRLKDQAQKDRLGLGFDKVLETMGENALVQGVCWGFWNLDHLEVIPAASDKASGFVALLDEMTSQPMLGIQFWQLTAKKPLYIRLFEVDGVTLLRHKDNILEEVEPKRSYVRRTSVDAAGAQVVGENNYSVLPVIPFYANKRKASELTVHIKSKIDAYDRIASDFVDNLDRANDVYWVLTNFGGGTQAVLEMLEQINKIRAVVNQGNGMGSATAEPHTIEVPYEARKTALELLRSALYEDFMALDMSSITGGSLTNVAIEAATADLNMKANAYEWQAFQFMQKLLSLLGIQTEDIKFRRQTISNAQEIVESIYLARGDLSRRKALELNPYILEDEIETIMDEIDEEDTLAGGRVTEPEVA